jgi:hypothetical protein
MLQTVTAVRVLLPCVALAVISGCRSSNLDESLTPDEYLMAGIPACDKPWSATEMAAAASTLTKIAQANPKHLPQYRSPKSGALFARLTSPDNINRFKDKNTPIATRFGEVGEFLQASNQLLKLYHVSFMQASLRGSEVIEIIGTNLRASVALIELLRELAPTLDKKDASYFNRMAAIENVRLGFTSMIASGFQAISERSYYQTDDMTRLLAYMQESFPTILMEVQPERRTELFAQLNKLLNNEGEADLRVGLEKLKKLMTAALEVEERHPSERLGLKLEDLQKRGVTMHRLQAGTLDSKGWCVAESAMGGFSVELPGRFNDYTQVAKATDGTKIEINGVAMVTLQGARYSAILLTRADGHYKDDVFDDLVKISTQVKGTRVEKKRVIIAGNSGVEISIVGEASMARFRGFLTERGIYQMIVQYSSAFPEEALPEDVTRFFRSFSLRTNALEARVEQKP